MRRKTIAVLVLLGSWVLMPAPAPGQSSLPSDVRVIALGDKTVGNSAVLIDGPDVFRTALNCTNNDSATPIRWGDSSVGTAKGQRVAAGASAEIENRGAIYMISEGGNVTVSCTKEKKK